LNTPSSPEAKEPSIGQKLFELAWPLIGINVLGVLALLVDTLMCARLETAELTLTALGFATQINFLLMMGSIGLNVGVVALVARAHGADEPERANHVVAQGTWMVLVISALTAVIGPSVSPPLMTLLGASEPVQVEAMRYLEPMLVGSVCTYMAFLFMSILRGIGNTRLPLLVSLLVNMLNFVFNYALILGNFGMPALGVEGAAYGTLMAYGMGVVCYLLLMRGRRHGGTFNVAGLRVSLSRRPEPALVGEIFKVGWPAALDMVVLNLGFMAVIAFLAQIDEVAVAAHSIGLRIQGLAFVPGIAVTMASAALVGQALGSLDVARAREVTRESVKLCLLLMTGMGLLLVGFDDALVRAFDVLPGSPLYEYSKTCVDVLGYSMPFFGVHIGLLGSFHGSGSTWLSLGLNMVGTLAVQVPVAYLLGIVWGMGPLGIWLCFPIGFACRAALEAWAISGSRWTRTGIHV